MKKRYLLLIIALGVFAFILGPKVYADEAYVELLNLTNGGQVVDLTQPYEVEDGIIEFDLSASDSFGFVFKGVGLDTTTMYNGGMTVGGSWTLLQIPGATLMNNSGFLYGYEHQDNVESPYSPFLAVSFNNLKIKVGDTLYNGVKFYFIDPSIYEEWDELYAEMAPNGELEINTILPDEIMLSEVYVTAALSEYNNDKTTFEGYCEDEDTCSITFRSVDNYYVFKSYPIKFIFQEIQNNILSFVNKYIDNFESYVGDHDPGPMGTMFRLEDLENINYLYTFIKHPADDMTRINASVNYISEIAKILEYSNIGARFDMRMGDDGGKVFNFAVGFMPISFDGVIYGVADMMGFEQLNAIYIPDDTEEDTASFIAAAKERIEAYLEEEITIVKAGTLESLGEELYEIEERVNVENTLGEYYKLTIGGEDVFILIVKDSSKMQNPKMQSIDIFTNVKVDATGAGVPLDSRVSVQILDKNSETYKNIIKKLRISSGESYELNIFSDSLSIFITELENGTFKVYLPISEEFKNQNLIVYFVSEEGEIEEHPVTIEGDFAVFETTHFSTYTLAPTGEDNPPTGDSIIKNVLIVFMCTSIIPTLLVYRKYKLDK